MPGDKTLWDSAGCVTYDHLPDARRKVDKFTQIRLEAKSQYLPHENGQAKDRSTWGMGLVFVKEQRWTVVLPDCSRSAVGASRR